MECLLDYWLKNYEDYFKNGTLKIGTMCFSTYICQHGVSLIYKDNDGIEKTQSFGLCSADDIVKTFDVCSNILFNNNKDAKDHFSYLTKKIN